jgi:hypothetical protein
MRLTLLKHSTATKTTPAPLCFFPSHDINLLGLRKVGYMVRRFESMSVGAQSHLGSYPDEASNLHTRPELETNTYPCQNEYPVFSIYSARDGNGKVSKPAQFVRATKSRPIIQRVHRSDDTVSTRTRNSLPCTFHLIFNDHELA